MDAHLFRRFCEALIPRIMGARMEKIHAPGPHVTVFTLYGGEGREGKHCLVLKDGRKAPLLFASSHRIPVNTEPPAFIMRLRKHLFGRRIIHCTCAWPKRQLFLSFSGEPKVWLLLDLKEGPSLIFAPPPQPESITWPKASFLALSPEQWKTYPVLTPALRRTLAALDAPDAAALLTDLEAGGGDVFLYEGADKRCEVSAWPLSPQQLAPGAWKEHVLEDPLEALSLAGDTLVYEELARQAKEAAARPFAAEIARLEKLLKKLDDEEKRLLGMKEKQKDALLLQSQIYLFPKEQKAESVTLEGADGSYSLKLDKKLTVRENMAALFHLAGRGKRGLEHLERRKREVYAQKEKAEASLMRSLASALGAGNALKTKTGAEKKSPALPGNLPKQVQVFRSSDGFLLLRGRDNKGNALALKMASPHDYWLHTANGPSAHVIIRRDHAGQDVPKRTLEEAGILAALKSWQKDQQSADIQYSLAKYIHPMKKAAPGMVRIDSSQGAFRVAIDAGLESRLEKN